MTQALSDLGPLFNQEPRDEGEARKQDGMKRVERNVDTKFQEAAELAVYHFAKHNEFVTVNDMWAGIETLGIATHENRASGPVMTRCAKRGWIEKTDRVGKTIRPTRNSGQVAIWRSLIYSPKSA